MDRVTGYHAHVYFDTQTRAKALSLCETAAARFPLRLGRMHDKAVGPHPKGSCQLAFEPGQFSKIVPWLMLERAGLTILVHPETGDHLADHSDHAMWLGASENLKLEIFK
ncbi:DOPA 4,5-dioxygenase family protein [Primorskyibacter sp. S87]|uniref:DOPA 4,5-dioxygenase family protein n=1 Tax=Primorskyibacter sp. S87 TaxID=3415126 RepID=UPI003C7D0ADA